MTVLDYSGHPDPHDMASRSTLSGLRRIFALALGLLSALGMSPARILRTILFSCAACSCGGPAEQDTPMPTFVAGPSSACGKEPPTTDEALARQDNSDELAVAEVVLVDACPATKGTWIVARDLYSHRRFLVGSEGCRLWASAPEGRYAVVRHRQTAGIFHGPDPSCVSFDGAESVTSDQSTQGVVVFVRQEDAEALAAARGWTRPR